MTVTAQNREGFIRATKDAVDTAIRASGSAAEGAGKTIEQAVNATIKRISTLQAKGWDWTVEQMPRILRSLEDVADEMGVNLSDATEAALRKSAAAGSEAILAPLRREGLLSAAILEGFPLIPSDLINTAIGYSAGLIVDVSDAYRDEAGRLVKLGLLTGESQFETIKRLEASMEGQGIGRSTFASLQDRAEAQVRTESLRLMSMHQRVRGAQLDDSFGGGLIKQWDALIDEHTRKEHREANGQKRSYNQPYLVGGELLDYVRDPKGSGWNTIECRCGELYLPPEHAIPRGVDPHGSWNVTFERMKLDIDSLAFAA